MRLKSELYKKEQEEIVDKIDEPQEKRGYKMVQINTGMSPSEIDKLEEGILYYFFFRDGKKKWYTGYYDDTTKK